MSNTITTITKTVSEKVESKHRLLSLKQAATLINVNRRYLDKLIKDGDFPSCYRIGKSYKVKQTELESWIDSRKD